MLCLFLVCSCCWRLLFRGSQGWVNLCLGWAKFIPPRGQVSVWEGQEGAVSPSTLVMFRPVSQPRFGPQLPATSCGMKEAEAGKVEDELAAGPRCYLSLFAAASLNLCPDTAVMGRKEGGAGAASCASVSSSRRVSGKDTLGGRQGSRITLLLRD